MGRSPFGVAIGVSGAAQMGQLPRAQRQKPFVQVMVRLQSGPQEAPGVLQGLPACGIRAGQPDAGLAQYH